MELSLRTSLTTAYMVRSMWPHRRCFSQAPLTEKKAHFSGATGVFFPQRLGELITACVFLFPLAARHFGAKFMVHRLPTVKAQAGISVSLLCLWLHFNLLLLFSVSSLCFHCLLQHMHALSLFLQSSKSKGGRDTTQSSAYLNFYSPIVCPCVAKLRIF